MTGLGFLLLMCVAWMITHRAYRAAVRREIDGVNKNIGARGLR